VRRRAPALLLAATLLVAWEVYARASGVSAFVLPAPSRIVSALWDFRDDAVRHAIPTIVETLVGFGLSIAVAVAAAIGMDYAPGVRRAVQPLLVASQTVPIIAIAPLVLVWFGFGLLPKVLVVVLVTFFPITIALLDGFESTSREATDLMRTFGASRWQAFRMLRWPAALPYFFTGLRISATYAVIAAVIAEYVGATEGLGIWMALSIRSFRMDLVFAAVLLVALLSIALVAVVAAAERVAIPWYRASRGARLPERSPEAA
jgi:ABC-type nitrate/sulfonate/bicarbonate transport system permease component